MLTFRLESLSLPFWQIRYGYSHRQLQVYPTVILPLTTIGLLMSFATSTVAMLPAINAEVTGTPVNVNLTVEPKEVKSENYGPLTDSKNVEAFINDYFADIPIMIKIARCESRNRHFNKSGHVLRGEKTPLDRGVMQINLYYHQKTAEKLGLDLHDIDDNVAYARYLYEKSGAKPWMSSSACWSKFTSAEIAKK